MEPGVSQGVGVEQHGAEVVVIIIIINYYYYYYYSWLLFFLNLRTKLIVTVVGLELDV